MRILLWHVHGSWATAFVQGEHEYLVPVLPGRPADGRGRARTWDWPGSVRELGPGELRRVLDTEGVDAVLLQRPHEAALLHEWTGRRAGYDVPAVYLEHDAPGGPAAATRHPLADVGVVADGRVPIVHVTQFNALMWDTGPARTAVIEHGIPDPGHRYTGERERIAAVVNEPVRRWRAAGTDVLLHVAHEVPAEVYGMGTELLAEHLTPLGPTAAGAAGRLYDLPQPELHSRLAGARAYLHPYRWTSLGLALLEAMALGLPVLALPVTAAYAAVPPEAGVLSADPDELAAVARRWLADPAEAAAYGKAAREHVLNHYSLDVFLNRWTTLLTQEVSREDRHDL
ncbi:Glycosyl transferases group 1 [Promicromonospora umidemergens]|uniref:Glycosyltransferase n=1 Tax=Promicromonospora umidemergens TaxID=629679 RepID=A0ABP8WVN6_9MICO|nr:glycosyltransferase [Promicromonospora umidemergens]MCP2283741.1 Glycosyl transferases group 1 [Promicromonospora umidemergens]